jgi:phosphoenolpyruvate synthase/pyruvate phosphate dikinase
MRMAYPFATDEKTELAQVGGKGMSLILMTQQGLPVPPGFVLSVEFFKPWLEFVQSTPQWTNVLTHSPAELKRNCDAVKEVCMRLELDELRNAALAEALEALNADEHAALFAVRSSSPEEDLEAASFAGGYQTVLGVTEDGIADAVRRSFASALDERVFVYKKEHGFEVDEPRIAVIIQKQIAADTAGVAFSLNPANNCYDEAVIDANFGLGESVVSGLVSPDSFVVDKVSRTILERRMGKKETSIWLSPDGGTYQEPSPSRSQLSLSDEQVLALTDALVAVEEDLCRPIDIEWAFTDGMLHLLQARPITAYFQLPEVMVTAPGEPKRLYADLTLTKWGMQEPVSVMGTDYLGIINRRMMEYTMGRGFGPEALNYMRVTADGRTYVVASTSMKMQGKNRVASEFRTMDALTADILASIDESEYIPQSLPPALKGLLFKLIRNNLGTGWRTLKALRNPMDAKAKYLKEEQNLRRNLKALRMECLSIRQVAEQTMNSMMANMDTFFPVLAAAELAKSRINKMFKDEEPAIRDKLDYLERALPDNVTVGMGLAMYRLSRFPEILECSSAEEFASRMQQGAFSSEFLQAWDAFMEEYGFRSPMEMDPAAPRYYEQPARFFDQVRTMAENTDPQYSPQVIFEEAKAAREDAYQELLQAARKKGKRKARQFEKNYQIMVELAGYRESPKYHVALITDMFRRWVLQAAKPLAEAGRLDSAEQAFDLTMEQFERALVDPSLDLRQLAWENTRYLRRLKQVREFPRVIDSRGRILRAPRKEAAEGELLGVAISPGLIRGPVKVLNTPDEKPVLPGDVLVARATDPGWTPLFLNAGAIVLEVGGMLQHGALVAREYGKPCVAGIENATSILRDGQAVEIDGSNGVVRFV